LRADKPDVIHETYYSPRAIGPQCSKRVLTIYDMIHEKLALTIDPTDRTAKHKALAAHRADHIICISESTRRDAIEILDLPFDKTSVVHLGYDLMQTDNYCSAMTNVPVERPFLLFVGNRGGYKNFLGLLQAIGSSRELRSGYALICFGGGIFNDEESKAITAFGLAADQVIQVGGNDSVLAKLYSLATAFIYPSLYEGFGIPPLEAMSFDCPVVCSNTSSIPEVVGDAGEYFSPNDIESMRLAIERVVCSKDVQRNLKAQGRLRLSAFSWDRCAAETREIYRKLA
jgi:glycosyltransferase involved in cell wall biosynthesis